MVKILAKTDGVIRIYPIPVITPKLARALEAVLKNLMSLPKTSKLSLQNMKNYQLY